jgi:hypothetical protein
VDILYFVAVICLYFVGKVGTVAICIDEFYSERNLYRRSELNQHKIPKICKGCPCYYNPIKLSINELTHYAISVFLFSRWWSPARAAAASGVQAEATKGEQHRG